MCFLNFHKRHACLLVSLSVYFWVDFQKTLSCLDHNGGANLLDVDSFLLTAFIIHDGTDMCEVLGVSQWQE